MRKLAEVKDEEALDLIADLLDPVTEICTDTVFREMVNAKTYTRLEMVKYVIKNHKTSVIQALAVLEGVPVEEYHCNALTLPVTLLEIVNDPEVLKLFT